MTAFGERVLTTVIKILITLNEQEHMHQLQVFNETKDK